MNDESAAFLERHVC